MFRLNGKSQDKGLHDPTPPCTTWTRGSSKPYDTQRIILPFFHRLYLQREPSNPHDSSAILATAIYGGGRRVTVGHMAREASKYISPLLDA